MHGRLRTLAFIVGLSSVPFQAAPARAEAFCELIGTSGVFSIADGKDQNREWRFIVEGVTYTSDRFDKVKQTTKMVKKANGTKVKETVLIFKDKTSITRTPNDDNGKSVDVVILGQISDSDRSGDVTLTDHSNHLKYKIVDPNGGLKTSCDS